MSEYRGLGQPGVCSSFHTGFRNIMLQLLRFKWRESGGRASEGTGARRPGLHPPELGGWRPLCAQSARLSRRAARRLPARSTRSHLRLCCAKSAGMKAIMTSKQVRAWKRRGRCVRAETLGSRRGGAALHRTADAFGLPAMHTGARGASASQRPMGLDPTGPLIVSGALPTSSLAPLTIALAYAPICFLQSIQRYTLRCERMRQFT